MNILNEIEKIEDKIIELTDGDHTGAELREELSGVASNLSYLRHHAKPEESPQASP